MEIDIIRRQLFMEPTTPTKHQSLVWEYFDKLPTGKARCRTCQKEIACTSGNTSGLRHLDNHHRRLFKVSRKFSISSRSMRPKGRNSRSRLEAWDWKEEILDLVSKHETERKKFSISSRELKKASRYALVGATPPNFLGPANFWSSLQVPLLPCKLFSKLTQTTFSPVICFHRPLF